MLTGPQACPAIEERACSKAGFALVEVLVALAILALALTVLVSVLADGTGRAGHAEKQARALLHAQSLLAAVGAEVALQQGRTSGRFEDGSRWHLTIEAHGDAADRRAWPVGAYRVSVEVAWVHAGQERSLVLTTLRLGTGEAAR
jgi:general secretion pathway protein I